MQVDFCFGESKILVATKKVSFGVAYICADLSSHFERNGIEEFSSDEDWISNWFSFSHFHVHALLACMAYACVGISNLETTLGYIVAAIIIVYLSEGIFSIDILTKEIASVQAAVFLLLLFSIFYFTFPIEQSQPHFPLPRKLTTSSFDRRKKLPVPTMALTAQFLSETFRVFDMVFGGGRRGYLGDMSG